MMPTDPIAIEGTRSCRLASVRWLLALVLLVGASTACQFVQNEFVTLDVARPVPVEPLD